MEMHSQGPHTAEHIYAIGRLILSWSVLEDGFRYGVIRLAGLKDGDGAIILHEMSAPGLIDRLRHLIAAHRGIEAQQEFDKILAQDGKIVSVAKLYAWRNLCAHNVFGRGSTPGTVQPLALRIRGSDIKVHGGELTAEYIYTASEMILTKSRALIEFLVKQGLGPETPPAGAPQTP